MKKMLITLAAIIGVGLIVVLIAQAEEEQFSMKDVTGIEGGKVFPGGPSEEERKAEAEESVKERLLEEYQQKQAAEGE